MSVPHQDEGHRFERRYGQVALTIVGAVAVNVLVVLAALAIFG